AGVDVSVIALPYFLNIPAAEAAKAAGVHYFDLTEDVDVACRIRDLADGADTLFVPQCGLAPGFISIVASHLVKGFDEPHDVRLRVGALPQFPDNSLKYNLTWSIEGLINEYCNTCEAIYDGERRQLVPLEGLEHFSLDGVDYEAFSTSGGIGTLCETLEGKVRNLNYKTVRYPGHRDMIWLLVRDLKLGEHREMFKEIIEFGIPSTRQDVVLIFVTVTGMRDGALTQESYARKIYGDNDEDGQSAIQKTTAAGVCAMVDMHREGKLPASGFVRQEDVDYKAFIANRFGSVYA
ncbi:MAG: saccharopine dehydrogenase C-terminal domain-containing protein, partial [Rhodospirillales bacterium]